MNPSTGFRLRAALRRVVVPLVVNARATDDKPRAEAVARVVPELLGEDLLAIGKDGYAILREVLRLRAVGGRTAAQERLRLRDSHRRDERYKCADARQGRENMNHKAESQREEYNRIGKQHNNAER